MLILCVNMQFVWTVSLAHTQQTHHSSPFFLPSAYVTIISSHPLVFALKILSKQFLPLPPAIPSGRYARSSCSDAYITRRCALNSVPPPSPGEPGLFALNPSSLSLSQPNREEKRNLWACWTGKRANRGRGGSFKLFNKPFKTLFELNASASPRPMNGKLFRLDAVQQK